MITNHVEDPCWSVPTSQAVTLLLNLLGVNMKLEVMQMMLG